MMSELKPCPFCGSEVFLMVVPPHTHIIFDMPECEGEAFVECTNCGAAIGERTEERAIDAWNRRV